jgi:hypothetical protein
MADPLSPAGRDFSGAFASPTIPAGQFNQNMGGEAPDMQQSPAEQGLSGGVPVQGPAQPGVEGAAGTSGQSIARHIVAALGGSNDPMSWAKGTLAGALAGAANVGEVHNGQGWLAGAARGAQGVQMQKRQAMLDQQRMQQQQFENQEKLKADQRAQQELENSTNRSKAEIALTNAQTAASIQTRQQNAARFSTLQKEDQLKVTQLSDEINKSENDQLSVLSAAGVDITKLEHVTSTDQLTNSHAQQAASGGLFAVPNGQEHAEGEDKAGAYLVPGSVWDQTISKPVTITTGYELDKNGKATPKTITAQEGTKVGTLLAIAKGAQKDLQTKQDQIYKQAQFEHEQASTTQEEATTEHTRAETNLTNLQAKQYLTATTPSSLGDTDVNPATGNAMTPKEADSAWKTFNEKTLQPLQASTDKAYRMASQAYAEYQAAGGKLPTGAQSMLMLSNHLSTTFGNVKGARVTKDMIQEHLGARGVSDAAHVAIQKLTNGDVLSPDQWKAFMELIGQSREFSYDGAIDNARANGLGKSIPAWLPKAPQPGAAVDPSTARIFKYAAKGDPARAIDALKAAGWSLPNVHQ